MVKKDLLRVNQTLEVALTGEETYYKTLVQEKTATTFSIALPVLEGKGLCLREGDKISGRFVFNGGIYFFNTVVNGLSLGDDNIPLAILERPRYFRRCQRRHFFRYPAVIDMEYARVGGPDKGRPDSQEGEKAAGETRWIKTRTLDISGGGIRFLCREKFSGGEMLRIRLILPGEKGFPGACIQAWGRLSREPVQKQEMQAWEASVEFDDLPERLRDKIIKYIFTLMRKRTL